jgi:hypothetical protein
VTVYVAGGGIMRVWLRNVALHVHRAFVSPRNTAVAWIVIIALVGMIVMETVTHH